MALNAIFDLNDPANYAKPEDMVSFLARFGMTPESAEDFNPLDVNEFANAADQKYFLEQYGHGMGPGTPAPTPTPAPGRPATIAPTDMTNPGAIYNFNAPNRFEIPNDIEGRSQFRYLQQEANKGLGSLLAADPYARRGEIEDALYERQREGIERTAGDLARETNERTFGRGIGLSSINVDYQGRIAQERNDALARARREAFLGAGAEARAEQAARQSALGQAFAQGTTGLNSDANMFFTNEGRDFQARGLGTTVGSANLQNELNRQQQESQFSRELDQRGDMAKANLVAAGAGAGASLFAPYAKKGLESLFGPGS